jgi:hypothetical protein
MNKRRFVRYLLQEPYSFVILLRNIIHPLSDTSRCALNYVLTQHVIRPDVSGSASGRITCCVGT